MGIGEDAGKKDEIRGFLERVSNGLGFIDDIWVERKVKPPESGEKYSTARSLSGKQIDSISDLLRDDIEHTFNHGLFTFRFVAAVPGSGKTAVLNYLRELIEAQSDHREYSVVINFALNELLAESGNDNFGVKFYSYVLTQTFWQLMRHDNELSASIRSSAEEFLTRMARSKEKVAQIKANNDEEIIFANELNYFLSEIKANFRKFFFALISAISRAEPRASFVYLIDELDALDSHQDYLQDARSVIRDLINEAVNVQKLRLMFYIVGRSDDVQAFITADNALHSRVADSVISLVACRLEECDGIRAKIEDRIKEAYSGCKDFNKAWQDLKNIKLEVPHDFNTLREFCRKYAQRVITVHESYFKYFDKSFNKYEGITRQKVESEALKEWASFLGASPVEEKNFDEKKSGYLGHNKWKKYRGKGGYTLLLAQTTTSYLNHNLDCYGELRHSNSVVAHVYGEAKNYSLIQEHIDTFGEWLRDFDYRFHTQSPCDLAYIVASSCSFLQEQKLAKKNIKFIQVEKILDEENGAEFALQKTEEKNFPSSFTVNVSTADKAVDINTADKALLIKVFKGTRIRESTINKIYESRKFKDLDDLFAKISPADSTRQKIQEKFDDGIIYFS
ncbi:MAG TPA: hypothetical protein V6D10_00200 [Trichocoleus sp.]|jgi:hypothetical protein